MNTNTLNEMDYQLTRTSEVLLTAEDGSKLSVEENIVFRQGYAKGIVIHVDPELHRQTVVGIGSSFTESSAFVLSHLNTEKRAEVMRQIFSEQGANFSLSRTPIGSCDFCVEGRYSYAEIAGDRLLSCFSIKPDLDGFAVDRYPGIKDSGFDLLPMIQQALAIKNQQQDSTLRIMASAWTAPPWMKDINDWYVGGNESNHYSGTGGVLKADFQSVYADYLLRYLEAYQQHDINIWAITPVNEPLGNSGQWESMHFSAESQRDFIKNHLGPKLKASDQHDTQLIIYDHSRDQLEHWADVIYTDTQSSKYVSGAAVHWYESSYKVFEDVFDRVYSKYPEYTIIHSEGCIDDLGNDAPPGVLDPEGFKESGWFDNDEFWWNENASDWGYTVPWPGVKHEDHPLYTPVHRYARNIIVSLNHWVSGWVDWNIVLDARGGPNHVGNYCGAPIMIDVTTGYVYYTPVYYILAQFSKTIRPGDKVVFSELIGEADAHDTLYACATINSTGKLSVQVLNTARESKSYALQVGCQYAPVTIPANAFQTMIIQLPVTDN